MNEALNALAGGKMVENSRGQTKRISGYGGAKKAQQSKVAYALRQASVQPFERAFLTFLHIRADRRTDPDNFTSITHKFVFDAMQKEGILSNDGWGQVLGFADYWTVGQPPGIFVVCDPEGTWSMKGCVELYQESVCQKTRNQQMMS